MAKECDCCKDLREKFVQLDEKVRATRALCLGVAPSGRPVPRCQCGAFCTVLYSTTHPVAGMRTYVMCDHCRPPSLSFDDLTVTTVSDWGDDAVWARSVNLAMTPSV